MSIKFNKIYIAEVASSGGVNELQGPLHKTFDFLFEDLYCNQKSFEDAESYLLELVVKKVIEKQGIKESDIMCCVGGDLMNQIAISNYTMKAFNIPFVGVYGACSTSVLSMIIASNLLTTSNFTYALSFCSSHLCVAERQFRYPNEYGVQKPITTTTTATGAGALIISKNRTNIEIVSATIGKVIDFNFKNPNDMGSAMAPAAFDVISTHCKHMNNTLDDYDCIVTGDLSTIGIEILKDFFITNDMKGTHKLLDCGCMLYDLDKQDVFSGGSGCACSILVLINYFILNRKNHHYRKILFVATGALLTPIFTQQKKSIPVIAHAIEIVIGD